MTWYYVSPKIFNSTTITSLFNLPSPLDNVFANTDNLPVFFDRLMFGMVELLNCDRCHFYLRAPQFYSCQILYCYCTHSEIPNLKETNIRIDFLRE